MCKATLTHQNQLLQSAPEEAENFHLLISGADSPRQPLSRAYNWLRANSRLPRARAAQSKSNLRATSNERTRYSISFFLLSSQYEMVALSPTVIQEKEQAVPSLFYQHYIGLVEYQQLLSGERRRIREPHCGLSTINSPITSPLLIPFVRFEFRHDGLQRRNVQETRKKWWLVST